ncbi:hypothetical protein [Alkalithermobacter paradoxus]|uniref:Uncharacterized protein n=1 Tax=Alkalithermobacter paradoxus TaxID=29349 RepID=A0A1V4I818_9FIRM|nr:hypothetical protein CLOTH_12610 [[Clostridium] thermoalcaliphilum]
MLNIIRYVLGILIILAPSIITGNLLYNSSNAIGGLHIAEFVMRTISLMLGLVVIYDATKKVIEK